MFDQLMEQFLFEFKTKKEMEIKTKDKSLVWQQVMKLMKGHSISSTHSQHKNECTPSRNISRSVWRRIC